MTNVAGLVLAGGLATRMGGGQKALLELGGKSLMARSLERLAPQVDTIAINANDELDRYQAYGQPVLSDILTGHLGPLAGVHAGMVWARAHGFTHIASVAGDTPFFPSDLIARLQSALSVQHKIAMAATPNEAGKLLRQPTFALWPVILAEDLEKALEDGLRKIIVWADLFGVAQVNYTNSPYDPFFNVNSQTDMTVAEGIVAEFDL